jgi:RNA polymerase sigma-70 factor, ECF subfamily
VRLKPDFSTTELAHEALIELLGRDAKIADRRHFFHVVAVIIRRFLIDQARERERLKHGAGLIQISLSAWADQPTSDAHFLKLDEATSDLEKQYPRSAQILELAYFTGLAREEIAETMSLSVPTVDRDLRFARAWLKEAMTTE